MKTKDFIYIALIAILFIHSMWLQKAWIDSYECSVNSEIQLGDRINEVSINCFENDSLIVEKLREVKELENTNGVYINKLIYK